MEGQSYCIREPVNQMSSGSRERVPPTVKWGNSGGDRLPVGPGGGAGGPGSQETVVLLIRQPKGWPEILQ